jgi:phage tail sheath protein FI
MVPVETFYGSNSVMDIDNNGNSLYIEDVINGSSMYVYVKASGDDIVPPTTLSGNAFVKVSLDGGQDATSTTYDPTGLWDFFNNKQNTPIDLAIVVPRTKEASVSTSEVQKIDSVVGKRLDMFCVVQANALASTSEASIVSDNTNVQGSITNYSYFGKYVGWNLVFDRYNSSRVYLPNAIYAAAVIARTDRISSPWEAPAGQERGVIAAGKQSVILVPDVAGRLYENYNLNTVRFLNGIGNVIWGQKTSQLQKTARDRINVRRMLNYVENGSERILNAFLFRGNTSRERERVYNLVNSFINTVYVAGGVSSYRVVCDNTNNTETTIAQNILNVDIFIQPTYTIEFIKITTTITASSVNVGEG